MKEKSQVEDIDRSVYDIRDEENDAYRMQEGLTPAIVRAALRGKGRPRVDAASSACTRCKFTTRCRCRTGVPSIEGLRHRPHRHLRPPQHEDAERLEATFRRTSRTRSSASASRRRSASRLAGVGAQYDSELVYHNVKRRGGRAGRCLHRHGKRADAANTPTWCASTS